MYRTQKKFRTSSQNSADKPYNIGAKGEDCVTAILLKQRWSILRRNYRGKGFEIDIIAKKGHTIIFIEVKSRSKIDDFDTAIISQQKMAAMQRGAQSYLSSNKPHYLTLRFDLAICKVNKQSGCTEIYRYVPGFFIPA